MMRLALPVLITSVVWVALGASVASAELRVGSVDLNGYCQSQGWQRAEVDGPAHGPNAAYRWRCASGTSSAAIDMNAACRHQYQRTDLYGHETDPDDAYTWMCYAPESGSVQQLAPISYTAFDGHTETLVPWQGERVTMLVAPGTPRDAAVMARLISALDRGYGFYTEATGREPGTSHSLNGRDEVAEVTGTCGAGCGQIGSTGIEILGQYFESMYQQVAQNDLYDQTPFYELGRNFWFWTPQLAFKGPDQDPVITGYAVWMRFQAMTAAGVFGAPFGGKPFHTFASEVAALAGQYESDPSLSFAGTLAQNKSPGAYGGTDFWASLMTQLASRHGPTTFTKRFWAKASTLPATSSTAGAVTNWVQAASYAACADLRPVFYTRWGFPRADGSVTQRPSAQTVAEPPTGQCDSLSPPPPTQPRPGSNPTAPPPMGPGVKPTAAPSRGPGSRSCRHQLGRLTAWSRELRRRSKRYRRHPTNRNHRAVRVADHNVRVLRGRVTRACA